MEKTLEQIIYRHTIHTGMASTHQKELSQAIESWMKEQGYGRAEDFELCKWKKFTRLGTTECFQGKATDGMIMDFNDRLNCPSCHGTGIVLKSSDGKKEEGGKA